LSILSYSHGYDRRDNFDGAVVALPSHKMRSGVLVRHGVHCGVSKGRFGD
jgi:hypothetical protein